MLTTREPTPDYVAAATSIADSALERDGIDPLNEASRLALRAPGAAIHWLIEDGVEAAAYGQWHLTDASGIVVVHPDHRGHGLGRSLVARVAARAKEDLALWAFGNHPAAQAFATEVGLSPARMLHQMSRPLSDLPEAGLPHGTTIRAFTMADLPALHRLNAAAFADHPEQGRWSVGDIRQRFAEPWFDPAGLLIAEHSGIPLGFHWTKRESSTVGEVYVLGVDPQAVGRGLGKSLLWAGLRHLRDIGCTEVELFVDGDNTAAVELYARSGFTVVRTDVLYRPTRRDRDDQRGN